MKVLKFGGSSVGSTSSIKNVKQIVQSQRGQVIVVVSALGGVTDQLIRTAQMASVGDKAYEEEFERIPFDLLVGASRQLPNAPLTLHATLARLNNWDQAFIKHLAVGADIRLSPAIYVSAGYNFRRSSEMKIYEGEDTSASHGAGLSLGGGIELERLNLNIGYAKYHVSASSLLVNVAYTL